MTEWKSQLMYETAIRDVKRRYFQGVDSKDWQLFASAFAADATMDMSAATSPPAAIIRGPDAIVEFVRTALDGITTIHHAKLRTLSFEGETRGTALWAMEDILFTGQAGALRKMLHGYGHYHEEYRLGAEGWRCSAVVLTRIHVDTF